VKTSPNGIDFIRHEEGCRLTAYQDQVGVWTIGVGHTGREVKQGLVITQSDADTILRRDLTHFEECVDRAIHVPQITQGQFDAMVSLTFNIGAAGFESSTLVKKLNAGDIVGAGCEFVRWHKASGKPLEALLLRRAREMWVFCKASP
jgi:lysozyme